MGRLTGSKASPPALNQLVADIKRCRICKTDFIRAPLPHEPRPVLVASTSARIAVCGQAPGTRVHASGRPFTDPSGVRLRDWMGVDEATFYDPSKLAIIPMGFCFPGLDAKGSDLPPRKECATRWRTKLFEAMPQIELTLLVGSYAQKWHLGKAARKTLSETVANWRDYLEPVQSDALRYLPLPHPSWRNNAWLARNPWFEVEVIPRLRTEVARLTS